MPPPPKREKYRTPGPGAYDATVKNNTLQKLPQYTFGGKMSKIDRWKTGIYEVGYRKTNDPDPQYYHTEEPISQTFNSTKRTAPHFVLGRSTRDGIRKMYVGESMIPETQGMRETPSPAHYRIQKQAEDAIRPKTPSWSLGGQVNRMETGYLYDCVHNIAPDPQHYNPDKTKVEKRAGTFKMGTETREEAEYVIKPGWCCYYKDSGCKGDYETVGSIGKQVLSQRATSPQPKVGKDVRFPLEKPRSPGPAVYDTQYAKSSFKYFKTTEKLNGPRYSVGKSLRPELEVPVG